MTDETKVEEEVVDLNKKPDAESATAPDLSKAEVKKDDNNLQGRVISFNLELKVILNRYNLALLAEPRILNGVIVADPKLVDNDEYQASIKQMKESGSPVAQIK